MQHAGQVLADLGKRHGADLRHELACGRGQVVQTAAALVVGGNDLHVALLRHPGGRRGRQELQRHLLLPGDQVAAA